MVIKNNHHRKMSSLSNLSNLREIYIFQKRKLKYLGGVVVFALVDLCIQFEFIFKIKLI